MVKNIQLSDEDYFYFQKKAAENRMKTRDYIYDKLKKSIDEQRGDQDTINEKVEENTSEFIEDK